MIPSQVRADALGRDQVPSCKHPLELAIYASVNIEVCIERPQLAYLHVKTSINGLFSTVF
jgi:hypothetical protein